MVLLMIMTFFTDCGSNNNTKTKEVNTTDDQGSVTEQVLFEEILNDEANISDLRTEELVDQNTSRKSETLYGLTLDSTEDLAETLDALRAFEKRVTTRIVFDEYIPASVYQEAVEKIRLYSDVMGELFDSEYIPLYSLEGYKQRVDEYLETLGDDVTLWEIGNEINGEWTGDPQEVAEKTLYAYQAVKQKGYQTALTLYYNDYSDNEKCWLYPEEKMRFWVDKYLDAELKENIDYLFVSYYEEDCNDHRPSLEEWNEVFDDLGEKFPNAKLGFGEVGISDSSMKAAYLQHYYTMDINHSRYVGGYFWWYGKQDMVPKTKPLWNTLNNILTMSE